MDPKGQATLYEALIARGVDGILVQGSIGEFFAMPMFQRMQHAKHAVDTIAGRVPCLVGVSSMLPDEIAPFANCCFEFGADAVALLPPWYFGFDPATLTAYFDRLLGDIRGSVYLYNFPARTGCSLDSDLVTDLARRHPNLQGIKDTVPGVDHTRDLIQAVRPVRPDFTVFSGFDDNLARNLLSGGNGVIGGLSNVAPEVCFAWRDALRKGDMEAAARGQQAIDRLMELYRLEAVFIPVLKEAARLRGFLPSSTCTFPMQPVHPQTRREICRILSREGLSLPGAEPALR